MPNQHDFHRITENIINPIQRHWNCEFDSETIADFVDDLAKFSKETLVSAVATLRQEQKRRPTLAHILEACRKASPHQSAAGNPTVKQPWHEREERREKLVNDYLAMYKNTSSIWREAAKDGWDLELLRYLHSIASLQAQMINPSPNGALGWDGSTIFGSQPISDDQRRLFLAEQSRQAATGQIDVSIPTGRIADWKSMLEWRKLQAEKLKQARQPTALPPEQIAAKTRLDLEIERQIGKRA